MTDTQDPYKDLIKVAVFRSFAEEATKNSHATIKQVWTILFTGGTFALLHSFDQLVVSFEEIIFSTPIFSIPVDATGSQSWWWRHGVELCSLLVSSILFVVFLLTFYRFYVGNIRVFDMKYDEVFKFIDSRYKPENWHDDKPDNSNKNADYQALLNYSTRLSGYETFQLMVNTLVIVYLTVLPLNPIKFLIVYLILLILDMLWILKSADDHFFAERFFEELGELPPKNLIEEVFPQYATDRWHINNMFFALVLSVFLIMYGWVHYKTSGWFMREWEEVGLLALGAVVALMNCVVDLQCTWGFYNPKFNYAYASVAGLKPPQDTKQNTECTVCYWLSRVITRWPRLLKRRKVS